MNGVREYVIAALLHDVGKLIRRALLCQGERARRHVDHSVEFVEKISGALREAGLDVEKVKELVRRHHEGVFGIAPYDRAAALERAQGDEESGLGLAMPDRQEHEIPLVVEVGDGPAEYSIPPCPLPQDIHEAKELAPCAGVGCVPKDRVCECYQRSYKELMRLAEKLAGLRMGYGQLVETLVHILKATTSFVPAAVYGVAKPNTSLFAHSVLAAALASTGGEFMLVSVDLGKIQEYISRARTTTWAMSILRGRSLHVSMLQKIVVKRLAEEVNRALGGEVVTYANVLLDTGGEVLMLIPRVDGFEKIAERLEEEVLQDAEGVLTVYITWSGPHRLNAIANFQQMLKELEEEKVKRKLHYRLYPRPGAAGNAKSSAGYYHFRDSVCEFCGRPAETKPVERHGEIMELCDRCHSELRAGTAARNLKAVAVLPGGLKGWHDMPAGCQAASARILGYTAIFAGGEGCDPCAAASAAGGGVVYLVNTRDFICGRDGVGYGFIYANSHLPQWEPIMEGAPKARAKVLSLGELEEVFYVKMDANSMGAMKAAASARPSGLVTFATAVSTAYELYPALLAGQDEYRESVYVVYAGGDDAFFAGDISALKYASEIVKYAERWGFKTAVGVKLEDPHYPVYYAFQDAEERLGRAKAEDRRRSIAVFSTEPLLYSDASEIAEVVKELERLVEEGPEEGEEPLAGLDRALRFVYSALLDVYRGVEQCAADRTAARRRIAEAIVRLIYFMNRRGEDPHRLRRIAGLDLSPDRIADQLAPALRCDRSIQKEIAKALLRINLAHKLRQRVLRSPPG